MACDPDGVIALNNRLPWSYPEELEFYKKTIAQQYVILGYNTFIEMPDTFFENHSNIVFSEKAKSLNQNNVIFVSSIDEFKQLSFLTNKKCYMIGGAKIAEFFLRNNLLDDFLLTIINKRYPGDKFFPLELIAAWPRTLLKQNADFSIYHYINPKSEL